MNEITLKEQQIELVNLMYRYINRFINSNELLKELQNIDLSKFCKEDKKVISKLISNVENIIDTIPNEIDEIEKKRLNTLNYILEDLDKINSNKDNDEKLLEFTSKKYNDLLKEKDIIKDGGKLFEELFKLMTNNSVIVKYATKMNTEKLLEFITNYISVPMPLVINQDGFNDLVKAGIKKDERESLWRLAFNYNHKNMDFSLIEDYFIEKRDDYYLIELISAVQEDLDINNILKKVASTKDNKFMNDCASRAIKLGLITNDDVKKIVVSKYTYAEFKRNLEQCVSNGNEPEYPFLLNGSKYMIIGLKKSVTFQRFGDNEEDRTDEVHFKNLDELYITETIDGILLKRDWEKIESLDDYNLL